MAESDFGAVTRMSWRRELIGSPGKQANLMEKVWEACNALSSDWLTERTSQMSGGQKSGSAGPFLMSWSSHDKRRKS